MARLRSAAWAMVWVLVLSLSLVVSSAGTEAQAQTHTGHPAPEPDAAGDCPWATITPSGALPPAVPVWCAPLATGDSTLVDDANSWLDDFNHGLSNAEMGEGYRVF